MNAPLRTDATFDATELARQDTVLSPRFYTTDFEELDRTDISAVRTEWDALIAEMRADPVGQAAVEAMGRRVGGRRLSAGRRDHGCRA